MINLVVLGTITAEEDVKGVVKDVCDTMSFKKLNDLEKKLLNDPITRKVFEQNKNIYLVGGYIRDLLFKNTQSEDLDFVVKKNLKETVNELSIKLKSKVIELKKEHMFRICLKEGKTLDFSSLTGSLPDDLKSRDFTFNAIAWSPKQGIIDPFGGIKDIKKGIIRRILKKNFKNDPLRLLRAYRFSSEFCINIEPKTRHIIRELRNLIRYPACERITLEFLKLLNGECPIKALKMALNDGLLSEIISLSFKDLERNIKTISKIEKNLKLVSKVFVKNKFTHGLTYKGVLMLEALLSGSKRNLLSLSTELRKRVEQTNRLIGKFEELSEKKEDIDLFELFYRAGHVLTDLIILTGNMGLLSSLKRFNRIMKKSMLSSEEIMEITCIKGGQELGSMIKELKKLEFQGVIRKREDAIKLLSLYTRLK